jgi:flavin-dependent dehydrogenase
MNRTVDVVVVGSGPAGCTAAILLGRLGLTVALLEAHRNPDHYKRLCTHSIRSSATPTLRRLGLDATMDGLDAVHHRENAWSKRGWFHERAEAEHGFNIRRITLDPVLRAVAAETPGVELVLGAKVRELTSGVEGRITGVVTEIDGGRRHFGSRMVVGADGYRSTVAALADLPGKISANERFAYQAGYLNVGMPAGWTGAGWLQEPDVNLNYVFCNNDGLAMLAVFHLKSGLADFKRDREGALLRSFASLTDGPDLSRAKRVTDVIGTTDYPSITRRRIVRPGVALVGDAAMVGDPIWGTGCGWAFQGAEWLVDAIVDALRAGSDDEVDAAAGQYQRRHRRNLLPHQLVNVDFSRRTRLNPLMKLAYGAAPHDQKVADRLTAVATRNSSPLTLFDPILLTRAAIVARKAGTSRRSSVPATGRA